MTQNPECHHQFELFDGRPMDLTYLPVNQISFRLVSLDTLKGYRQALIEEGITQHCVTDHGNAFALFFQDSSRAIRSIFTVDLPFYLPSHPCGKPARSRTVEPAKSCVRTEAM